MRTGRPRRRGIDRYPCGRERPLAVSEVQQIAARMPHRLCLDQKDTNDQKAESELGRMFLLGRLGEGEYQAGIRFGHIVRRYLATISPPRLSGRGEVLGMPTSSFECSDKCAGEDCECVRRRQAYGDAHSYVAKDVGHVGLKALRVVVILDNPCPPGYEAPLRWALCSLKRFFDIKPRIIAA